MKKKLQQRAKSISVPPALTEENGLTDKGFHLIAGVDEVGRGALAGPLVAAAVILPLSTEFSWFSLVRDSKELPPEEREQIFEMIKKDAIDAGIGIIPSQTIDSAGIVNATRIAMSIAIEQLSKPPDYLLLDGRMKIPQLPIPQKPIVRGDKLCLSIACASIVAKVTRDRIMQKFHQLYPDYAFSKHKGYGTREHLECLQKHGPSLIHRQSFSPVREVAEFYET